MGDKLFKIDRLPEWYENGAVSTAHSALSIDWYELPYSYVLMCYPRDFTPVCTKELIELQRQLGDFELPVIAASTDSPESHSLFFTDEEIFPDDITYPIMTIKEHLLTDYGRTLLLNEWGYLHRVCIIVREGEVESIIQIHNDKQRDIDYIRSLV